MARRTLPFAPVQGIKDILRGYGRRTRLCQFAVYRGDGVSISYRLFWIGSASAHCVKLRSLIANFLKRKPLFFQLLGGRLTLHQLPPVLINDLWVVASGHA